MTVRRLDSRTNVMHTTAERLLGSILEVIHKRLQAEKKHFKNNLTLDFLRYVTWIRRS